MTTGNALYLLMVIGVFVGFSAMLAYVSWIQSRLGPDIAKQTARRPEADRAHADHHQSLAA